MSKNPSSTGNRSVLMWELFGDALGASTATRPGLPNEAFAFRE